MMLDDMETVLSDIQEFITGERPIDSSDRILATVLFLDIAASTERAAELGDTPWRNLFNSYYAIVRKELARFRGKETNTTGDSFLATFDGPALSRLEICRRGRGRIVRSRLGDCP